MGTTAAASASRRIRVKNYTDYRLFLQELFEEAKKIAKGEYSYREFSEDLGLGNSSVSCLLATGKRKLTSTMAGRIAEHLKLPKLEAKYFVDLAKFSHEKDAAEKETILGEMLSIKSRALTSHEEQRLLEYHSIWYHAAIYEMMALPYFRSDPEWIATYLRPHIRKEQAANTLELLCRLQLARFDATKGRHVRLESSVVTNAEVPGLGAVRFHMSMLKLAEEAMSRFRPEERNLSSLTIPVKRESYAKLVELIESMCFQALDESEKIDAPEMVVQLNVQLFPLTRSPAQPIESGSQREEPQPVPDEKNST